MSAKLLREKGLRATPFREKVLWIFEKQASAIDMEILENELGEFDRITLYRTLRSFIDKGIIHEIMMPGETKKMAICNESCNDTFYHNHEHVHFKCKVCNQISCLELKEYPEIRLRNYIVESTEIQAVGVCEQCNVKKN